MKLYLNECSIIGQATDKSDALKLFEDFLTTFSSAKKISHENKGYVSKGIFSKIIYGEITVKEFFVSTIDGKSPSEVKLRQLALQVLFNKPRLEPEVSHNCESDTLSINSDDVKGTSFEDAVTSKCGALIVSMKKCKAFEQESLIIISSKLPQKKTINICDEDQLRSISWTYEPNEKHKRTETMVGGKISSPMTLNIAESQHVLTNGVLLDNIVYGHLDGRWYKFHCHEKNKFHGFEYTLENNVVNDAKAKRLFDSLNYERRGQIFFDNL